MTSTTIDTGSRRLRQEISVQPKSTIVLHDICASELPRLARIAWHTTHAVGLAASAIALLFGVALLSQPLIAAAQSGLI